MLRHWGANRAVRTTEHNARNARPRGSRCGWQGGPWSCRARTPVVWAGIAPPAGFLQAKPGCGRHPAAAEEGAPQERYAVCGCAAVHRGRSGPWAWGKSWGPSEHCRPESWLSSEGRRAGRWEGQEGGDASDPQVGWVLSGAGGGAGWYRRPLGPRGPTSHSARRNPAAPTGSPVSPVPPVLSGSQPTAVSSVGSCTLTRTDLGTHHFTVRVTLRPHFVLKWLPASSGPREPIQLVLVSYDTLPCPASLTPSCFSKEPWFPAWKRSHDLGGELCSPILGR